MNLRISLVLIFGLSLFSTHGFAATYKCVSKSTPKAYEGPPRMRPGGPPKISRSACSKNKATARANARKQCTDALKSYRSPHAPQFNWFGPYYCKTECNEAGWNDCWYKRTHKRR